MARAAPSQEGAESRLYKCDAIANDSSSVMSGHTIHLNMNRLRQQLDRFRVEPGKYDVEDFPEYPYLTVLQHVTVRSASGTADSCRCVSLQMRLRVGLGIVFALAILLQVSLEIKLNEICEKVSASHRVSQGVCCLAHSSCFLAATQAGAIAGCTLVPLYNVVRGRGLFGPASGRGLRIVTVR